MNGTMTRGGMRGGIHRYLDDGAPPVAYTPGPLAEDENNEDDLDFQQSPEQQEAAANEAMSSGQIPGQETAVQEPQGDFGGTDSEESGVGSYLGSDVAPYQGNVTFIPGLGPVTREQIAGMIPLEKLPNIPQPIAAPSVGKPDTWLDRVRGKIGLSRPDETPATQGTPQTYQDRLTALQAEYNKMPVRNTPNWLERLAAGALGGAAGWSNAARRAAPINIQETTQGILNPGYADKLAAWQSRVVPLEKAAEIAGQQSAAGWKGQQIQAESALKNAQVRQNESRAAYYDNLAKQNRSAPVEVTKELSAASGGIFHEGQFIPAATATELAKIQAGKYEKPEKTIPVTDPGLAQRLGVPVGTAVPYSLYQSGVNANMRTELSEPALRMAAAKGDPDAIKAVRGMDDEKARTALASRPPRAEPDEFTQQLKRERLEKAKNDDIDNIGKQKNSKEENLLRQRAQELARVETSGFTGDPGVATTEINRRYAGLLQNVQNEFAQQSRRRGIPADDFDIDPRTLEYKPRPVAPPPTQAPVAPPPPPGGIPYQLPDGSMGQFPNQQALNLFKQTHHLQ